MDTHQPAQQKKALLLFSEASIKAHKAYPAELVRMLSEAHEGIQAYAASFEELLFAIDEDQVEVVDTANQRSLTDYDVIYFRHWSDAQGPAMAAARFCARMGIPFVDTEVYRTGSASKITQYMNLQEAGIPFPKTLIAPSKQLLKQYAGYNFSFPVVVKNAEGSRGTDNYVAHNEGDLQRILEANPTLTFVMQTFIPNEGDYRVIVMGDTVPMVIERKAAHKDTHLNNTSQGGSATNIAPGSLPPEALDMAVRAAKFFGCQIAGVDLVRSLTDGQFYCFEVNRSPQIEHSSFESEKASHLARYLQDVVLKSAGTNH